MDKIKSYSRSSQSGSTSPKGSSSNPYTQEEYYDIIDNGKHWPGGFVEGLGYISEEVCIYGSYNFFSSFSWDSFEDSMSFPWSLPGSSSSSASGSGGSGGSTGGSSGSGNSNSGHGTTGGGVSSSGSSSTNNLDKAFPELPKHQEVGNCVRVVSVRLARTSVSTLSKFTAVAYDRDGNVIPSTELNGFFLERGINYEEATVAGHKAAILQGEYSVVPGGEGKDFDWYLASVPGRSGIAIHKGNFYYESKGCLIVGSSYSYNKDSKAYEVRGSAKTFDKLSSLFKEYGHQNIRIVISEDF